MLRTTHLPHFPSASSLSFFNSRLYVIGDDATHALVLDSEHHITDSIQLFPSQKRIIPKNEKADLESSFLYSKKGNTFLIALSSFSAKNRNAVVQLDMRNRHVVIKNSSSTKMMGGAKVNEPNIEGSALVKNKLVLGNRANLANDTNHLLVSDFTQSKKFKTSIAQSISIELPDENELKGLSGLAYNEDEDLLLITFSTENTYSSVADGTIGDSYLGVVYNISDKLQNQSIKPDFLISLSSALNTNTPQKIESVAIESSFKKKMILHLSADNDNGQSSLFKIELTL